MPVTICQIDDLEEARALHDLAFPSDDWTGNDHTFWVARDGAAAVGRKMI